MFLLLNPGSEGQVEVGVITPVTPSLRTPLGLLIIMYSTGKCRIFGRTIVVSSVTEPISVRSAQAQSYGVRLHIRHRLLALR